MLGTIKKYIKNIYNYMRQGGFRQGGVVYVNVDEIKDDRLLYGKHAVITGGSSGIGLAIAQRCIECGAEVFITGKNKEKLDIAVRELGDKAKAIVFDATDFRDLNYSSIFTVYDKVDILINNAGISPNGKQFPECSENLYDSVLDTNLKGMYFLSQAFVNYCIKNEIHGTILNVASNSGIVGLTSPYGLSKKGVVSLTEGIAKQYYRYGIRCNAVAPDVTISNITEWSNSFDPDGNLHDEAVKHKRAFRAEEIAEVALFLISSRSKCINGQVIACDNAGSLAENTVG